MGLDKVYAKSIKRSVPPGSNVTWNLSVGVPRDTTTTLNWNKNPHPQVVLHIFNGTQELEPGCVLGEGGHSLLVVAEVVEIIIAPNLKVESINLDTPIYSGSQTEINVSIINDGTGNVTATFPVEITIRNASEDEVYTNTANIEGLNAGAEEIVTFYWTPESPGNYNITVTVDPEDVIDESDEVITISPELLQ